MLRYDKSYIEKFFGSLNEYHSMVELFRIAYGETKEKHDDSHKWIIELGEIMNWQAMSVRSGVWTYYEITDDCNAKILIEGLTLKNESEILNQYCVGIDNYSNEELMDGIDKWITNNEDKIYRYIADILIQHKDWFNTLQ